MPARQRTSDLTILIGGLLATMVLAAIAFAIAPDGGPPRAEGSSYAAHPAGGKAAYLLLESTGHRIERSVEPMASLRRDPEDTTIVFAEPVRPPAQQDLEALEAFVRAGGHVIATGASGAALLPGLIVRQLEGDPPALAAQAATFPSPLTRDAPSISLTPAIQVRRARAEWVAIYGALPTAAVLTARMGRGQIVWLAAFEPFSNERLALQGHVELLGNAAGPPRSRALLWDEYYHGYGRSFWSYVAATPLVWGVAQGVVIGLAALLTFGRRRGPARSIWHAPRTSPVEFIDTMAVLYGRAGAAAGAVQTALTRVRRLMFARAGAPPATPDDRLAALVALGAGGSADDMRALLSRARAATSDGRLGADEARQVVIALMDLERQVVATRPQLRVPRGTAEIAR